jgi:hypothetical protein
MPPSLGAEVKLCGEPMQMAVTHGFPKGLQVEEVGPDRPIKPLPVFPVSRQASVRLMSLNGCSLGRLTHLGSFLR